MAIRIKELNNAAEKTLILNPNERVLTSSAFRLALAEEYKLQAIDIELDFQDQCLIIPAFRKTSLLGLKGSTFILGAGFDKTGDFALNLSTAYGDIIGHLLAELAGLNLKDTRLELRTTQTLAGSLSYSDKVELIVDLNKSCTERLKGFSQSTRRNMRQPFKQGFHFKIDNSFELLKDFYPLYLKHMHAIGSLPHSWEFFAALHARCQAALSLFIGYMNDTPVVASFAFINGDELYGAWLGMDPAYKKHNLFLTMLWSITEYCEQTGIKTYNLGRSSTGSNAYEFKRRFADKIRPIHYYQLALAKPQTSRSAIYSSAAWLIRNSPPFVMNTLSRHLLHKFY
jgi:hypothetical protein